MDPADILYGETGKRENELSQDPHKLPKWVDLGPHYFENVREWSGTSNWMAKVSSLPNFWTGQIIFARLDSEAPVSLLEAADLIASDKSPFPELSPTELKGGEILPSTGALGFPRAVSVAHQKAIERLVRVDFWMWEPIQELVLGIKKSAGAPAGVEAVGIMRSLSKRK